MIDAEIIKTLGDLMSLYLMKKYDRTIKLTAIKTKCHKKAIKMEKIIATIKSVLNDFSDF
jgi:hypothetical protein